ncbi:hypothetical protein B7R23_06195 [Subtercola boreus]|nr:hypothetical protein B7R24_06250 [Subtercola boreus]RFA21392.1 hypothetical protein B7R23_06195 [Subtercola boreus]
MWPNGAVSIILLPSGDQGASLFDLAREWVGLSLVAPALWVRPERVSMLPDSPPSIRAWVIGVDSDREVQQIDVDLFEALARESLSLVRLIKVRSALPSREQDDLQDAIGQTVSDYITLSLPSVNPEYSHLKARTSLTKVSLIAAPTEFQLRERVEWADTDQGVTLVASPEDRSSPWAGDAFVRDNARFVGFTLMHIATVGGLWNGVPTGSLDIVDSSSSAQPVSGGIWMPRVFVNAVLTDGLARRVAAQVLESAADPSSALIDPSRGVPAEGTAAIPDERIDDYVGAMVEAAFQLDDAKLSYRAPVLEGIRGKDSVGVFRQLGLFTAFAAEKILWMPYWFVAFFRDGLVAAVQRLFQGNRGRLEVVAGGGSATDGGALFGRRAPRVDSRDRMLLTARSALVEAEATAQQSLNTPAAASALRSTPRLWTGLRELVFGSLDGSADLEDRGFTPIEDKTPVFGRVSDVLPDANDVWHFPGDVLPPGFPASIGSQNLHEASTLRERIGSAIRDTRLEAEGVQTAYDAAQSEYVTASARFEVLQKYLLAQNAISLDGEGRPTVLVPGLPSGEADPAAAGAASGAGSADDSFASLRPYLTEYLALPVRLETLELSGTEFGADLERLTARLETHRTALASFETWLSQRERSFLWRTLARMNRTRDRARSDLSGFERRIVATELPEAGTLVRLRQSFHGRIGLAAFVLLVIGALLVLLPRAVQQVRDWPPYPADWMIVTALVVLVLLFLLGYLVAYYRGWSEFDRTVAETLDELHQLGRATTQVRSELHRLASLHGQSMDWLELLAVSLYRPWAVKPSWLDSGLTSLDTLAMPFAMQVAQAYEGSSTESVRLQHAAARSLVRTGWRARAFEQMLAAIGTRLGLSPEQLGLDALDHDLPHASNNSRRIVRDNMTDGVLLETVARTHLGELIQEVQSGALYESKPRVRRLVSDPLARLQSDASGIDTSVEDLEWSGFLTGALGEASDPISPLSALGIAPFEVQDGHHIEPSTFVLAPARIASGLAAREGRRVHITSYSDAVARPLDIVLRIDLAGPLPLSAVHLWGEGKRRHPQLVDALAAAAPAGNPAARADAARCPQCGKTSCPAADPASGAACVNSGI